MLIILKWNYNCNNYFRLLNVIHNNHNHLFLQQIPHELEIKKNKIINKLLKVMFTICTTLFLTLQVDWKKVKLN